MLDEKTLRLFTAIHKTCGGNYKIVEENELLSTFRESDRVDGSLLREMICNLEGHAFVDVRYAEDGEYCLCALPAGLRFLQEVSGKKHDERRNRGVETLIVFCAALLGGFLGALCAVLAGAL